jgi:hypothetical protein
MAPIQVQLEQLVEQGKERTRREHRSEDREEHAWCLDREHQDLTEEARQRVCSIESKARWEKWEKEDKEKIKPDPDY